MIFKILMIWFLVVSMCWNLQLIDNGNQVSDQQDNHILQNTFNDPECSNPCWLGIEIGATDKATTLAILNEHEIDYSLEGSTGDSVALHNISVGLFPEIAYGAFNAGGININNGVVTLMTFDLDICVSTLITAYGSPPKVWQYDSATSSAIFVYPAYQLIYSINTSTFRVDGVALHLKAAIPSSDELVAWDDYAPLHYGDALSEECTDIFTRYQN